MNLIEQPNRWSCGAASLAMLLDLPLSGIVARIGHDGSEILFPEMEEPRCRRGFVLDELQTVCFSLGKSLVPFEAFPLLEGTRPIYSESWAEERILRIMQFGPGLIEGMYSFGRHHICAWDGYEVFDPTGPRRYRLTDRNADKIHITHFWRLL